MRKATLSWSLKIAVCAVVVLAFSCDREGRKQCEWVLEPESTLIGKTEPGYIPVCARNRKTNKQDCRIQATLEYAKSVQGKKFRYVDMVVASPAIPRTLTTIKKFCD